MRVQQTESNKQREDADSQRLRRTEIIGKGAGSIERKNSRTNQETESQTNRESQTRETNKEED